MAAETTQRSARERLVEAAFALFADRGYEQTTVDDITERAGVGRSTFFRTFGTKEEVLFPRHDELLEAVRARLGSSTPDTATVALREAARIVLRHYLAEGDLALARYRLTRHVPALRDRELSNTLAYQRVFRRFVHDWLEREPGGWTNLDLRAELTAAAIVTAHNHVLRRWLRGHTDRPEAELDAAMNVVLVPFTAPRPPAHQPAGTGSIVVFRTDRDLETVLPTLRRVLGEPG
jgi:AcrR family transcriptional regulator